MMPAIFSHQASPRFVGAVRQPSFADRSPQPLSVLEADVFQPRFSGRKREPEQKALFENRFIKASRPSRQFMSEIRKACDSLDPALAELLPRIGYEVLGIEEIDKKRHDDDWTIGLTYYPPKKKIFLAEIIRGEGKKPAPVLKYLNSVGVRLLDILHHEIGHALDYQLGINLGTKKTLVSESPVFTETAEREFGNLPRQMKRRMSEHFHDMTEIFCDIVAEYFGGQSLSAKETGIQEFSYKRQFPGSYRIVAGLLHGMGLSPIKEGARIHVPPVRKHRNV